MVSISTVTPVYRGEQFLENLVSKLEEVRGIWGAQGSGLVLVESIFVIDGATDQSEEVLNNLKKGRDWLRVITLSKNYGQHPATVAGILHSSGDWVVTLDEDLQHNPVHIFSFLRKTMQESADVCYGKSLNQTHDSLIRDAGALVFKKFIALLSGISLVKVFNSFRLIRGDIARAAAAISSHESYYDVVLTWFTNRVTTVSVSLNDLRNQEGQGQSGYSVWGLIKHGWRMVMTSNIKVLRLGLLIGIMAFIVSIGLAFYAMYSKLYKIDPPTVQGWYSTILVLIFFGGLLSLMTGFVLETVSYLLLNAKGKPPFFIIDRSLDEELNEILDDINEKVGVKESQLQ